MFLHSVSTKFHPEAKIHLVHLFQRNVVYTCVNVAILMFYVMSEEVMVCQY